MVMRWGSVYLSFVGKQSFRSNEYQSALGTPEGLQRGDQSVNHTFGRQGNSDVMGLRGGRIHSAGAVWYFGATTHLNTRQREYRMAYEYILVIAVQAGCIKRQDLIQVDKVVSTDPPLLRQYRVRRFIRFLLCLAAPFTDVKCFHRLFTTLTTFPRSMS